MKTNIYKYTFLIPAFLIASISIAVAQQNAYDARIGIHAGIMNYYGDLNSRFLAPNNELRDYDLGFLSYGISAERNLSSSWAAKVQYNRGQFIANDRAIKWDGSRDFGNSNDERSLNARTDINDFSLMFTYYTDNGKLLSRNAIVSPYISFGVGLTLFEVFSDLRNKNGSPYYYWADNTIRDKPIGSSDATIIEQDGYFETNVTALQTEKDYSTSVLNIPLAAGLKFRLADRLNLNLDYTVRYTFTDYLDDVSGDYKDEYSSSMQAYAANPTNALAEQRGNDDGNDWYAFASISLHYSFGKKQQAFVAPVINYSARYEQNFPRTSFEEIEKVSAEKRDSITGAEALSITSARPAINRNIQKVEASTAGIGAEKLPDERELRALERADTLDSLTYLVHKQRLENELYALRLASADPAVRLKTKEDSLETARQYDAGEMDADAYDTLSVRKEQINQQLAELERSLQRIVDDTVKMAAADTIMYTDSSRYNADARYSRQIDSLENEVASLQRTAAENAEARLDSLRRNYELEREILEARIEAMEADTAKVAVQTRRADSVAIADLQERYATLEQRIRADSEAGYVNQNYTDDPLYTTSTAERERINALEREIQSLKRQREYAGYRENITVEPRVVRDTRGDRRIDGLEREVDRLSNRNNTLAISAPPVVVGNEADNARMEEEIAQTQQMVDSLQQQIAALSAQANIPTTNIDSAAINAEVEALKQEISVLRANIIDMDEDKASQPEIVTIPEMPKTEVFFGVGVSALSGSDKERIGTLINFLKRYPEATVDLRGYTDPTGSPSKNLVLSKRRAESVKQELLNEGIADDRISTEFFGADNAVSGNLVYGRRVEIIIK